MDTKLTLKLDKNVIDRAKIYAAKQKVSVSSIVENYLDAITLPEKKIKDIEISDFVKSIGIEGVVLSKDFDYKKEIQNILCEKYGL